MNPPRNVGSVQDCRLRKDGFRNAFFPRSKTFYASPKIFSPTSTKYHYTAFFFKTQPFKQTFFQILRLYMNKFFIFHKNARPNNADPQQKTAFAGIFTEISRKSPKIPCAKAAIPSGRTSGRIKEQKTRYRSYFVFFLFFPRENLDLKKSLSVSRFLYRNTKGVVVKIYNSYIYSKSI